MSIREWIILVALIVSSCTMNVEETFIEGKDNRVQEAEKTDTRTKVHGVVKVPLVSY